MGREYPPCSLWSAGRYLLPGRNKNQLRLLGVTALLAQAELLQQGSLEEEEEEEEEERRPLMREYV